MMAGTEETYLRNAYDRASVMEGVPAQVAPRAVAQAGVIGAGTMGVGIALSLVKSGIPATLFDKSSEALARADGIVRAHLGKERAKGKLDEAAFQDALDGFSLTTDIKDFSDVDLVIEAVFESMSVKQEVFTSLDQICKSGAILATNTSTLDVNAIAEATSRPADCIGLHFFSPAHIMRLIEIVKCRQTSEDVQVTALALAKRLGKVGVVVGNCYGFAGNRMVEGFGREANYMLLEGTPVEKIDETLRDFGFAMGAFEVADLVGIDVPYQARQENSQALDGDLTYYRIADALVEKSCYGQKSGKGYYLYPSDGSGRSVNPAVAEIAKSEAARLGVSARNITPDEIVERCVFPLINEGANILHEGIAARASDLDAIFSLGYGFPAFRGGPMRYADSVGLPLIIKKIRSLERRYGRYWTPSPYLVDLALSGRGFTTD